MKSSKIKIVFSTLAIGGVLTLFQNCGSNIQFSERAVDGSNTKLAAVDTTTNSGGDDLLNEDGSDIVVDDHQSDDPSQEEHSGESCNANDHDHHGVKHEDASAGDEDSDDQVVCVLEGQGESVKLGLIEGALDGSNHAIARAVCISRSACLSKVSMKFKVKGIFPGSKGVCGHNPKVKHLSDAELDEMLK